MKEIQVTRYLAEDGVMDFATPDECLAHERRARLAKWVNFHFGRAADDHVILETILTEWDELKEVMK